MAVFNYISSQSIIGKVFRDLRFRDQDYINDMVEWLGESLDAIGTFAQTESSSLIVRSNSHRARLPAGLVSIQKVYYTKTELASSSAPKLEDFAYELPYGDSNAHPAIVEERNTNTSADRMNFEESYFLSGGYIRTSFESDWILISYQKIHTDLEGFPMVPDMYEFNQALYWYIVYKLLEGGRKHPTNGVNYFQAEQRWLKYCQQARNRANMPSYQEAVKFRDSWARLIPEKAYIETEEEDEINAGNLEAFVFDRVAPDSPTNLTATPTSTSISITWTASNASDLDFYRVFLNGSQIDVTTLTSYTFTSLTASTTYNIEISAVDAQGNQSARTALSATTSS
jgi:hypothetical protein